MFAVIYKWKVKQGSEGKFQEAWEIRTREIAEQVGGLGSRLHMADDGTWIAYAQWPDRETWEAAGKASSPDSDAKRMVTESIESVETLFRLELVKDLLVAEGDR